MDKGEREQKPEISKETSILQVAEEEWDTCVGQILARQPRNNGGRGDVYLPGPCLQPSYLLLR